MSILKVGDQVPNFDRIISAEKIKNKKLILYFYPKDNTPGCTDEACNLRDNYEDLKKLGYEVIGISPDSEKSHQKFTEKFSLPFHLISDGEKEILELFGVWAEKKMYGKSYMGVLRKTFIINENGIIEKIIEKVDTKNHAKQIAENE
jgi:peroxiredoxin Q/BCP